jgi:hypothetical protein
MVKKIMALKKCFTCEGSFESEKIQSLCQECERKSKNVVVGGLDFGRFHDYTALCGITIRNYAAEVSGLKIYPHVDYSVIIRDVVRIYREQKMKLLAIDSTDAMVEPIAGMLSANGVATSGINFGRSEDSKDSWGRTERKPMKQVMIEFARACMQEGRVKLPKRGIGKTADELLNQLREQQIVSHDGGRVRYDHPNNSHDDLAWAFLMALYSSRKWLSPSKDSVYIIQY